jgi:nucleotide-binding universal stress UspA family protein
VWLTPIRRDHALLEMAKHERADLVVAGTHQRHGLERLSHPLSMSRTLLRFAPTNVLLVPESRAVPLRPRGAVSRVLVATDLSWASNQAVPHGYALLPHGGTLRLLHVVHPLALPGGEFDQGIARSLTRTRHASVLQQCEQELRALTLEEADAPGVVSEIEIVEHREPAVAIAQAAERFGADVVCLAAHEADSVFGRIFKSHIQSLLAKSSRPLLIVHPPTP